MRWLGLLLIATAIFALPASAANVNPRVFVLSQVDVPAHYEFDKDNSTIVPSELAAGYAGGRRVVDRAGYVNGYLASYINVDPPRWRHIVSAAFVFRRAEGARLYLAWLDKQFRSTTPLNVDPSTSVLRAGFTSRARVTAEHTWRGASDASSHSSIVSG